MASAKAQAIRDKTEAQSLMTKTLAGAAAELVKNDPALVQRAAEAFIAKEIGHQHNRERIALKAIEHLKETPDAETMKPEDDWLNMFARLAQEASSDRMQDLWSKILAGQLRAPNAFSLQTLRFASELDEPTAALFEKWSAYVFEGSFLPCPPQEGEDFIEVIQLEEFGLLSGVTTQLSNSIDDKIVTETVGAADPILLGLRSHAILLKVRKPFNLDYRCALLTRIGRELYPITRAPSTIEIVKAFAEQISKDNVVEISAVTLSPTHQEEVIWSPPNEPAQQQ